MRGILIIVCFVFIQSHITKAQETIYNFIKPGDFKIGFQDTLIFDSKYEYEAYNYSGKKPFFVQIWHPLVKRDEQSLVKNHETDNNLIIKNLFKFRQNSKLKLVQHQLMINNKDIFIRDFITEDLNTGQKNEFGIYTDDDIFELITQLKTQSVFSKLNKISDFPIIIYHHGSQSNSFENYAMAEYFASRGFIFVASNFHLPYENTTWGLKPYDKLIKNEDEESFKTILRFSQSLSNSPYKFVIGHSLGAQMGVRTFDQDSTVKGMISLETTIEFKTDYDKIKELWPEVFQKIISQKANYPFPVMLCAATGEKKPFVFFENLKAPHITYVSTKKEFEHNAYTSLFYLRYFLDNAIKQNDKALLKDRLKLYAKHLEAINKFLNQIMDNKAKKEKEIIFITD